MLQAALTACHARARRAAETDCRASPRSMTGCASWRLSPVVDLNRAIAHSMAFGPEAGLRLVDEIGDNAALRDYAPLPAARGDFLFRAGRLAEARSEFQAAATLTRLGADPAAEILGHYLIIQGLRVGSAASPFGDRGRTASARKRRRLV